MLPKVPVKGLNDILTKLYFITLKESGMSLVGAEQKYNRFPSGEKEGKVSK